MAKIIVGTQGRINEIIGGIPDEDILHFYVNNDKAWVIVKSEYRPIAGEVIEKIVEKEIEVIKEVDNPKLVEEIQTLQDALSDALNAEEAAKKIAEDLQNALDKEKAKYTKEVKSLKEKVKKLTVAITAEE